MAQDYVIEPANAKVEVVTELRELVGLTKAAILTDYRGLSVADLTELRKKLRATNAEFRVVKNTLFKLAADGLMPIDDLDAHLSGPTAIGFAKSDPVATAKVIVDFVRDHKAITLKAGVMDGRILEIAQVEALSKVPPREILISQMLGSLSSPITGLVGALNGILSNFLFTLEAIVSQGGEIGLQSDLVKQSDVIINEDLVFPLLSSEAKVESNVAPYNLKSSYNKEFKCWELTATFQQDPHIYIAGDIYNDFFSLWWETDKSLSHFLEAARLFVETASTIQHSCKDNLEEKEFNGIVLILETEIKPSLPLSNISKLTSDQIFKLADGSEILTIRIATNIGDLWYDVTPSKKQAPRSGIISHCPFKDEFTDFFTATSRTIADSSSNATLMLDCLRFFEDELLTYADT